MLSKLTLNNELNTTRRGLCFLSQYWTFIKLTIEIKHSQPFINLVFIEQRRRAPFGQRQVMVTHVLLCSGWSLVRISIPWDRAHPQTTLFGGPSLSNPKTTYGTGPWSIAMFGRCGKGLCNKSWHLFGILTRRLTQKVKYPKTPKNTQKYPIIP